MNKRFIVIEGLDGSGKSTLVERLFEHYSERSPQRVLKAAEPAPGSPLYSEIRIALAGQSDWDDRTLALAFATNRVHHQQRWTKFLETWGDLVFCDRHLLSSLVYQTSDWLALDDVYAANRGIVRPDLTLYLDVTLETSRERVMQRGRPLERYETEFERHAAMYEHAMRYLADCGHVIARLNADATPDEVLAEAIALIDGKLDIEAVRVTGPALPFYIGQAVYVGATTEHGTVKKIQRGSDRAWQYQVWRSDGLPISIYGNPWLHAGDLLPLNDIYYPRSKYWLGQTVYAAEVISNALGAIIARPGNIGTVASLPEAQIGVDWEKSRAFGWANVNQVETDEI